MANCFVRWWRARLLNGYKHIAMMLPEVHDNHASDMEELVQDDCCSDYSPAKDGCDADNNCSSDKPSQDESHRPSTKFPNEPPRKELNFEEFQCDVSLEGNKEGNDRQEFSFTLYDFNGHGRITQDDIAGLVRTIYDAVGNSVTLPPCGSKTIKVKLTVSPDKTTDDASENNEGKLNNGLKPSQLRQPNSRTKKDLQMTINEKLIECQNRFSSGKKSPRSTRSGKDLHTLPQCQNCSMGEKGYKKFGSVRQQTRHRFAPNCYEDCLGSPMRSRKRYFQKSGSFQKQELLAIIRDNMEKNNLNYNKKQLNNEYSEGRNCRKKYWDCYKEINDCVEKRHCYLDLAGINNSFDRISCLKVQEDINHSKTPQFCRKANHCRSRSQDHNFEFPLCMKCHGPFDNVTTDSNERHSRSKSVDHNEYEKISSPKTAKYIRNKAAQGHSSSPHHLKHKNRERDHQRAMQQVLEWLEKEHIDQKPSIGRSNKNMVIEKHEHHHVHEHVHHHYHHYSTGDPVVV